VSAARPAAGLFEPPRPVSALADVFANTWQLGYVTTDLDRGMEFMSSTFGLDHCLEVPTDTATFIGADGSELPWETRIAMGSRGGMIVELIEPVAGEVGFYTDVLPPDGSFAVRFHHLASYVEGGDEVWEKIGSLLSDSGLRFDYTVLIPDRVRAGYVNATAELGHYLEICQLQTADTDFFSSLVNDSA
jgi:hypothetical protein